MFKFIRKTTSCDLFCSRILILTNSLRIKQINFDSVYTILARQFITRALLAAENYTQAMQVLKDEGCGAADGCSVNITFLGQEGERIFHNIEMAPTETANESELSEVTARPGEHLIHTNS